MRRLRGRPQNERSIDIPPPVPLDPVSGDQLVRVLPPDIRIGRRYFVRFADVECAGEFWGVVAGFVRQNGMSSAFTRVDERRVIRLNPATGERIAAWEGLRFTNGITVACLNAQYYRKKKKKKGPPHARKGK